MPLPLGNQKKASMLLLLASFFLMPVLCFSGEASSSKKVTLSDALRNLSGGFSVEFKGMPVSEELPTVRFENMTLEEALKNLLRGYNYVLIADPDSRKMTVWVLSKAMATRQNEPVRASEQQSPAIPEGSAQSSAYPSPVTIHSMPSAQPAPSVAINPAIHSSAAVAAYGASAPIGGSGYGVAESSASASTSQTASSLASSASSPASASATTAPQLASVAQLPPAPPGMGQIELPPTAPNLDAPQEGRSARLGQAESPAATSSSSPSSVSIVTGPTQGSNTTQSDHVLSLRPPGIPGFGN